MSSQIKLSFFHHRIDLIYSVFSLLRVLVQVLTMLDNIFDAKKSLIIYFGFYTRLNYNYQ